MAEPTPQLIEKAQQGDPEAFGALIISQQQYIYSIAMSIMRQPEDAADLTQEACMKLIRVVGQYNGDSKFTTWLYRLVINLGRDELRRRGRRVPQMPIMVDNDGDQFDPLESIADDDRWTNPADAATSNELHQEVMQALETLEDHYRLALTLYYFDDLKYNDIAEILDVPLNTVKSYIRRGKERLATTLQHMEAEQEYVQAPHNKQEQHQASQQAKSAHFIWALGRR